MKSSSLPTTILHENGHVNESISDANNNQQIEKDSSPVPTDKLVFTTTTTTTNPKSSYWTVTDREAEWYKLSIPVNQSILNNRNQSVPCKKLPKPYERKKFTSNNNDQIDRPTYV